MSPRRRASSAALAVALVLLALAAAVALAATASKYRGALDADPGSRVTLKVERADGEKRVIGFKVRNLLISCKEIGDARLGSAMLDGEATVDRRGRFKLQGDDPAVKMVLKGKLRGPREAEGSVSYAGATAVGSGEVECASGKQAWAAER